MKTATTTVPIQREPELLGQTLIFARKQSFVAGPPPAWYLQFMVKDAKKYATTGGWGFAQFDKDGKPADEALLKTCFPCHVPVKARDFAFTRYTPYDPLPTESTAG